METAETFTSCVLNPTLIKFIKSYFLRNHHTWQIILPLHMDKLLKGKLIITNSPLPRKHILDLFRRIIGKITVPETFNSFHT